MQGPYFNTGCLIEDSLARVNPPRALWPPILKTRSLPGRLGCLAVLSVLPHRSKGFSRASFLSQCKKFVATCTTSCRLLLAARSDNLRSGVVSKSETSGNFRHFGRTERFYKRLSGPLVVVIVALESGGPPYVVGQIVPNAQCRFDFTSAHQHAKRDLVLLGTKSLWQFAASADELDRGR